MASDSTAMIQRSSFLRVSCVLDASAATSLSRLMPAGVHS